MPGPKRIHRNPCTHHATPKGRVLGVRSVGCGSRCATLRTQGSQSCSEVVGDVVAEGDETDLVEGATRIKPGRRFPGNDPAGFVRWVPVDTGRYGRHGDGLGPDTDCGLSLIHI